MPVSAKRKSRHSQLKDEMLKIIADSEANTLIPSETSLAKKYGVCRSTMSKAMLELTQEGYLIRRAGKGTFVAPRDKKIVVDTVSSPRTQGSVLVAYPDFFSYGVWECVHMIEMEALKNNYNMINLKINQNSKLESLEEILRTSDNIVGAILISVVDKDLSNSLLKRLEQFNIPLIINTSSKMVNTFENVYFVSGNHKKSGYMKMDCLLKNGHRKIGLVQNEPSVDVSSDHMKGVKQAVYDYGIRWKSIAKTKTKVNNWSDPARGGYEITKELLENNDLTALLVETVTGAFGALRALHEMGLKCPDDVSIVTAMSFFGLDDMVCPALSSVITPNEKSIQLMFDIIAQKENFMSNNLTIEPELVERESVKNINNE